MKLRPRRNKSGSISWQLDYGVVDGERKRVSFEDQKQAEKALAAAVATKKNLGALGLKSSPLEMAEFLAAKARLPAGVSMMEVVEFYMREGLKVTRAVTMRELVKDFIWSRRELGRDARTVQTYQHILGSLARTWPQRLAHELTRAEIRAWLQGRGWAASTQNKAIGHVRGMFQWAIVQKHAATDPCEGMERATSAIEEIEDLALAECEALLRTALRVPRVMPFVALGLFRGMRRSELQRLRWEEINLDDATVIAAAAKVKTRQRRVVELTPQIRAWIDAAGWTREMMREGPVAPGNLKPIWPQFWKAAGLTRWPHNALRHTFASMHYAAYQDESALQAILGQRSRDVLHSNYRALKSKREAERFWSLMPPEDWQAPAWWLRDPVFKFLDSTETFRSIEISA